MSVNHLSPSAFAVLRHRNWTGLSFAKLIDTGRLPIVERKLKESDCLKQAILEDAANAALGEVALVEEIPARREVVREVEAACKAISEGERVLYDGVELFTAIMLADEHDAAHRAVEIACEVAAQKEENELRWDPSRLILFLEENEQYGDDWSEEIKELKAAAQKPSA